MLIAIMMESDMKLSDDLLDAIIDKVKSLSNLECFSLIYCIFKEHLIIIK